MTSSTCSLTRRLVGYGAAALFSILVPGAPPCYTAMVFASEPAARIPKRDWVKAPAVVEMTTPEAIYALGDVHGDYDRMVKLLTAAGLIVKASDDPTAVQWKGGKSVLVCTGDLIDKGTQSIKIIALFQHLQSAAEKVGFLRA